MGAEEGDTHTEEVRERLRDRQTRGAPVDPACLPAGRRAGLLSGALLFRLFSEKKLTV